LVGDEGVEVGVGEHLALALSTVADGNVAKRARRDVALDGLNRASELCRALGERLEPVGRALACFGVYL
jgi:hypothetical protein